jgi:glutathione synthase
MSSRSLTFAFVMDPIEDVDIEADTTFVLMLEAQRRGHRVLTLQPTDLGVQEGKVVAQAREVSLQRVVGQHAKLEAPRKFVFDEEIDIAFQRKDPPVDTAYVTATQILGLCKKTLVLNRPEAVIACNEKLFTIQFAHLMPATVVTRDIASLREFMSHLGGEMILKPLHGKGGEGVFHVDGDDRNLASLLELATQYGQDWAMAQEYLPAIRQGDKRILLVDGEPIGAVMRVPAAGETRANLHVGGRAKKTDLDADDLRIVEALAPVLKQEGLFFVGIDVIGGKLTEINVTSPTGIQEINNLEGGTLETRVIEAAEKRVHG